MNKAELIEGLKYTEEKHRNDIVDTCDTNISMLCFDVLKVLKNCIEIPEGATVGDVMKTMFPEAEIKDGILGPDGKEMVHMYTSSDEDETILHMHMEFTTDIWNSPFKITGEE